jgi:dethiobiotin synthetase
MNKENIIFIAGTGTGVGKTFITASIYRELELNNKAVITQKWVQSGSKNYDDIKSHLNVQNKTLKDVDPYLKAMCPYQFDFPGSPHLAAAQENDEVSVEKCLTATQSLSNIVDFVLVEGSGGLMVPLNPHQTYCDVLEKTKYPTVLVVDNTLGSINHALLSIEALKSRQVPIIGVVFTQINPNENELILKDNPEIVAKLSDISIVVSLPNNPSQKEIAKVLAPLVKKIIQLKE